MSCLLLNTNFVLAATPTMASSNGKHASLLKDTHLNLTNYEKPFNSYFFPIMTVSHIKRCMTKQTYGRMAYSQGPALSLGILLGANFQLNLSANTPNISMFYFSHFANAPSIFQAAYFASSPSLSCSLPAKSLSELLCVTSKILTPPTTLITSQFRNSPATKESTP